MKLQAYNMNKRGCMCNIREEDLVGIVDANFIRTVDLVAWLQWHLRNRPVGSIHADIQKALKEFDV